MMTQATCKRCQASYKVSVARGLKTSRLCPACRQAERIRKRAARLGKVRRRTRKAINRTETTLGSDFLDKRSKVTRKGYERLYGADWDKRRREVWERDKGICQLCLKPVPFGPTMDADHYPIPRRDGRRDNLENLRTTHGFRSREQCHTIRHGRTIQWTRSQP